MALDGHRDGDGCGDQCGSHQEGEVELPRRGVAERKIVAKGLEQPRRARRMGELGPGYDREREDGESFDDDPDANGFPGVAASLLKSGCGGMPGIRRYVCCHLPLRLVGAAFGVVMSDSESASMFRRDVSPIGYAPD